MSLRLELTCMHACTRLFGQMHDRDNPDWVQPQSVILMQRHRLGLTAECTTRRHQTTDPSFAFALRHACSFRTCCASCPYACPSAAVQRTRPTSAPPLPLAQAPTYQPVHLLRPRNVCAGGALCVERARGRSRTGRRGLCLWANTLSVPSAPHGSQGRTRGG